MLIIITIIIIIIIMVIIIGVVFYIKKRSKGSHKIIKDIHDNMDDSTNADSDIIPEHIAVDYKKQEKQELQQFIKDNNPIVSSYYNSIKRHLYITGMKPHENLDELNTVLETLHFIYTYKMNFSMDPMIKLEELVGPDILNKNNYRLRQAANRYWQFIYYNYVGKTKDAYNRYVKEKLKYDDDSIIESISPVMKHMNWSNDLKKRALAITKIIYYLQDKGGITSSDDMVLQVSEIMDLVSPDIVGINNKDSMFIGGCYKLLFKV